jgi:drug/metabolite transporter (DMT)-like permease
VSLIWAFSFSLIKGNLVGLDSNMVAFLRLSISFIVFLPFLRIPKLNLKFYLQLFAIGIIQYGLMYISYIASYQYLAAWQVALFTILTPIYVSLIDDIYEGKINKNSLFSALIAIFAAFIINYKSADFDNIVKGFFIIQISNISFAFGQVAYKRIMKLHKNIKNHQIYSIIYLGAVFTTLIASIFSVDLSSIAISPKQIYTIIYLGIVASGICFFLWNLGATKVNISKLAIMNNMKIPTAIFVALLFFGEKADLPRLFIGSGILIVALYFNKLKIIPIVFKGNKKERE